MTSMQKGRQGYMQQSWEALREQPGIQVGLQQRKQSPSTQSCLAPRFVKLTGVEGLC